MSLELANRPVWSRSQVSALGECRRKFALTVKSARDAALDPVYARAAALKKLKNRHLWAGSFLHDAVGGIVKNLRQGNAAPDLDTYLEDWKRKMREHFKASKEGTAGTERLLEHQYGIAVAPELWRGHWNAVESGLRWFVGSKWCDRLSRIGPECWKAVDELLEFDVNGIKSYVKIDCAIESDGRFFLIDWKTSKPSPADEPGLLVGALYAHEVWGAEPDKIEAIAVSLQNGAAFNAAVSEESLMETHLRIEEESARLEEAKTSFGSDPFSVEMPETIQTCRRCSFQGLCHPGGVEGAAHAS